MWKGLIQENLGFSLFSFASALFPFAPWPCVSLEMRERLWEELDTLRFALGFVTIYVISEPCSVICEMGMNDGNS